MLRKLAFLLLLFAALYGVPAQARQIPLPGAPACDPKKQSCVTPPAGPPSCQPGKTGATCNGGGPATQGAGSSINVGAGNPINVITGNKYQREVDMPALPGVLGLEIVRHYNSFFSSPAHSNGILGRGWKLSYETDLYANSQAIQILQADGNRVTFDRDARDPSLCTTANPENGSVRIVRTARGDEYTWTWENGRRLSFNTRGRLVQIAAPSGEFVSMQHDAAGMLLSVTDPQGRSLQLRYLDRKEQFAADRFRGVQSIESPVGRFTYAYGSAEFKGTRVDKGQLRANLVKAGLPGAVAERIYHYEDARHPTLLTGISIDSRSDAGKPLRQRIATYGYDADGRGVLTVKGEAARLERGAGGEPVQPARLAAGTGVEQVTLDSSVPGRTVISNSLGQKTVYRHALIGGNFRLLEVRGAGCATCGEANVRYTYDANGRVNSISQLSLDGEPIRGKSTEYDQHGRTVKVSRVDYVKGKPVASQWQLRYEYAGASQEPVLVASPSVVPGREVQTGIRYNDIGQPLAVTQTGWAPGIGSQQQPTPLVRTTAYRYVSVNGRSLLSEIDGPLANGKSNTPADSDITRFEWDAKGNAIVAMIAPGNHRSTVRYDRVGRIAAVSNAEGRTTAFDYDARNLLVGTTSGGMSERIQYDAHGNIVELGHGDGVQYQAQARFGTDAAGRNIWTASSLGILERNRYDTEGNLIEASTESASLKRSQRYVYDAVGRLSSIDEPGGGTRHIRWNAQNLPESLTDTLGRERSYRYDTMGNLAQVIEAANTVLARLQETSVRFEHDVQGRASAVVTPSGALTRYVRDDFGRTIGVTSADSGTSTRSYDAAGRLIGSTDATGNRAVYEYEVSGRIARQTVIDGGGHGSTPKEVTTTWTYEGNRLTAIDYPGQAERYRYDEKGLLADRAVILTLAGGAKVTSLTRYRHDAMGRLESISLPDGSTIEYKRNAQHQVVALERNRVHTSWLRWLLPAQSVMAGLERDIVGLKHATFGNGIQAFYQRSKEGALARIVYRQKDKAARGVQSAAIETLLGIAPAHAENTGNSSGAADTNNAPVTPSLPGALSFPQDSAALLDYRYLWDSQGNLLHTRGKLTASSYVYDAQDRLIVAGSRSMGSPGAPDYARYFLDGAGNRVLAQENLADQSDLSTNTAKIAYTPASNRWRGGPDTGQVDYDASGQPARIGSRRYDWDAFGRLTEVHQGNKLLGSYRYNHKGERIGKSVDGIDTYYMYEGRQLAAELDSRGHITRQYIYLADQPIALIGQREGILPAGEEHSWLGQLAADIATIFHAWLSDNDAIAYLHNDHLGTTQVVTDGTGRPLWQAHYSPYGKVVLAASTGGSGKVKGAFKLNLRLPGQYDDGETGLYYNDHRYYDPQRGRYLTPDPLGLSGGLNSYAYVAGNPLKYVDPSGLILFAFDGTNNSNPAPQKDQLSNVWKFANAYNDGNVWYMSGVGRPDPASGIGTNGTDEYNANTARARVDHMLTQLDNYMNTNSFLPGATINLDITGFSRGAAEARDFSNKVAQRIRDNAYKTCLAIRFMGLWDTVAQFGAGGYDNDKWQLSVPAEAKNVFQAVALNEYRLAFPGESILGGVAGQTRIERGFIGSHADIGGGYAEGDLSDIPLIWMHKMATDLNIVMRRLDERDATVSSPVIHDKAITGGAARAWRTRNATGTIVSDPNQRKAVIGGMSYSQTAAFISYYPVTVVPNPDGDLILVPGARRDAYGDANIVGDIKMADYSTWLKKNYGIDVKF